jgi:iron complex outermembrane receptor protein
VAGGVRAALIGQFNAAVAAGNAALATEIAGNITALSAFARLNNTGGPGLPVDFTQPIFGASGFTNLATVAGFPGLTLNGAGIEDEWRQTSNNWALFTHNIFTITDGLDLTVGARYTHEKKKLSADLTDNNTLCTIFSTPALAGLKQFPCVTPSVQGGTLVDSDSKSENKLSGTVVLSWKPTPELLTYASYSRGYKAGGFNLDRAALTRVGGNGAVIAGSGLEPLKFKPEINDAIELGMKYNGRGIDLNVALFHQLFKNFQLNTFNGLNFIVENINSCDEDLGGADEDNNPATGECTGDTRAGVRSVGAEVELFTRPLPNVSWNLGVVYANTRYRHDLVGSDGRPLTNALFQLPGRRVSNSAEWTGTTSLAWTPPIGGSGMRGLFYVDARYMSKFNTGSDLDIEKTQDDFTVVNARIGLHGPDQAWGIELWAQNLLNEDFTQVGFDAPLQGSGTQRAVERGFITRATQLYGAFLGEPRTYGLTLRAKWAGARRASPAYEAPPAPPPPPPAPATQTCPDGSVIDATAVCPVPPAPPPPPPAPERG